jgi:hypothetical protein
LWSKKNQPSRFARLEGRKEGKGRETVDSKRSFTGPLRDGLALKAGGRGNTEVFE